jgi:hypothetical protein
VDMIASNFASSGYSAGGKNEVIAITRACDSDH